jgi:hypothetical protein
LLICCCFVFLPAFFCLPLVALPALQVARLRATEQRRLQQQLYQQQRYRQHSSSSSSSWGAAAPPAELLLPAASTAAEGFDVFLDQLAAAVHDVLLREQADMMQSLLAKAAEAADANDAENSSSSSSSVAEDGSGTCPACVAQHSTALLFPLNSSSSSSGKNRIAPGPLSSYLADVLWGFAKLNHTPQDDALPLLWVEGFAAVAAAADAVSFSQVMWALGQLQLWPGDDVMACFAAEWGRRMAAAAAAAAAAEGVSIDAVAQQGAVQEQQLLGARALSNILWSCAVLGYTPPADVLARVWAGSATTLSDASPQALSNMLWAVASLDVVSSSSWMSSWQQAALLGLQQQQQQQWNCADLANAAWALGKFAGSAKLR